MFAYIALGLLLLFKVIMVIRWYFGTKKLFRDEVKKELTGVTKDDVLITEEDLEDFPKLIKNYLLKAGVVEKPRVRYFRVAMTGEMKMDREKPLCPGSGRPVDLY
jgi:hypothetical protein